MGQTIPYAYREQIIKHRKLGKTFKSISESIGFSESGVKKIWYAYEKEGNQALTTKYHNCGHTRNYSLEIETLANELRDNQQGGAYIRSKLEQLIIEEDSRVEGLSLSDIPHERSIQRWWKKAGTQRAKGKPSDQEKKNGVKTHMIHGK